MTPLNDVIGFSYASAEFAKMITAGRTLGGDLVGIIFCPGTSNCVFDLKYLHQQTNGTLTSQSVSPALSPIFHNNSGNFLVMNSPVSPGSYNNDNYEFWKKLNPDFVLFFIDELELLLDTGTTALTFSGAQIDYGIAANDLRVDSSSKFATLMVEVEESIVNDAKAAAAASPDGNKATLESVMAPLLTIGIPCPTLWGLVRLTAILKQIGLPIGVLENLAPNVPGEKFVPERAYRLIASEFLAVNPCSNTQTQRKF